MFVVYKGEEACEEYLRSYVRGEYTDKIWDALIFPKEDTASLVAGELSNDTGEAHEVVRRPRY